MRILHITPAYAPSIGGIESVIAGLCGSLIANGHVSDVVHVGSFVRENEVGSSGEVIYRVPRYGGRLLGISPHIGRIAKDYDLLHVHDPQLLGLTASVALFAADRPAVLSTHGGYRHTKAHAFAKSLHVRFLMRSFLDRFVCVCASSYADYEFFSRFSDKVQVLENAVQTDRFLSINQKSTRSPYNWIYWGRIARHKRLDQVVRLVAGLNDIGCPVKLVICGRDFDGSLREVERQIMDRILGDIIRVVRSPSDAELESEIATSGFFVSASGYEGFGITVIEAMAAGLGVIAKGIPAYRRWLGENNFFLSDFSCDTKSILDLREIVESCSLSDFKRIGSVVSAKWSWSNRIHEFITLYRATVGDIAVQ